jgi:multidrug resistance efflux pump
VFASAERRPGPLGATIAVTSLRKGRSFRFEPEEFELAKLFDGTRDAKAVRAAAAELGNVIDPIQLEAFAAELSQADLLLPGTDEPLPVPPLLNVESRSLGWNLDGTTGGPLPNSPGGVQPPAMAPGSIAGVSALRDSVTGLLSGKHARSHIVHKLPLRPLLPLGQLLALPAMFTPLLLLLLVLFVTGLTFAFGNYRASMAHEFLALLRPGPMLAIVVLGSWFVNFFSKLARAAVVARYTGELPDFGLTYQFHFFPWFDVDTKGAPERTEMGIRMRIVGAVPVALMFLFLIMMGVYLATFRGGSVLAPVAVDLALVALVYLLIGINPLIKRDGYYLLATLVRTPDLREQAVQSLFGYWRPWLFATTLPLTIITVYALLCLVYVVLVCVLIISGPGHWLYFIWGPTGVIVFILLTTLAIYDFYRRLGSRRGSIGNIKLTPPDLWIWIIAFTLAALALFPYTFEPSGDFQVIARKSAEAHALTSGDVREIYVHDGDWVKAGQPLVKLNDDQQIADLGRAEGELENLQHQLGLASQGQKTESVQEAQQEVETARTRYAVSKQESTRLQEAYKHHAISVQERDAAVGATQVAYEGYQTALKHLAVVSTPTRSDTAGAVEGQIKAAEAQVVYAKQELAYTVIRAPMDGRVSSQMLARGIGQYFNRGQLVATILADKMDLELDMPEYAIGEVKPGSTVTAKAYAYPGTEFTGRVKTIAPVAQLQTPLGQSMGVNTAESQTSYNVVRVLCEVDDPDGQLRPDMTGYAKVQGRVYPAGGAFLRPVVRLVMVEIWSWLP